MNFNKLINDSKVGVKRNISSRREKTSVSIEEFNILSQKYFNNISNDSNLFIEFHQSDKETLIFILRWYYHLWIEIDKDIIEVSSDFPKEFQIISEVNKFNHPHTPKTFEIGTKMYFNSSSYSSCNWLNGIPLWNNKGEELVEDLTPSCQINYNYISILNY